MVNKEKCNNWCSAMLELLNATTKLTTDETEYIIQKLNIAFAELKIEELEAKHE